MWAMFCRVLTAIMLGAVTVGQISQAAPGYGKAKSSAARIFNLLDSKPLIDSESPDGEQPVSSSLCHLLCIDRILSFGLLSVGLHLCTCDH